MIEDRGIARHIGNQTEEVFRNDDVGAEMACLPLEPACDVDSVAEHAGFAILAGERPSQHDRAGMDSDSYPDGIELAAPPPFVPALHLAQYGEGAAQGPEGLSGKRHIALPYRQDLVAEMIDNGGIMHGSGMAGPPVEIGEEQIDFRGAERFAVLGIAHDIREQGHGGSHVRQGELLPWPAAGVLPLAVMRYIETMLIHG